MRAWLAKALRRPMAAVVLALIIGFIIGTLALALGAMIRSKVFLICLPVSSPARTASCRS